MGLGSWRKKGGASAPPFLSGIGRRLLANLQRRREVDPSVPSHATQVELPDGSVVRAQFVGSQPIVTVTPGRSSETDVCVLRMESGMLDLGTPTSITLGGLPFFDSSKPLRYRGTLWDCEDDRKPGRVYRLTDAQLTMTCDDIDDAEPPESDACDPATRLWMSVTTTQKKQAQASLPASMWTGLMRRYVQALYGAPGAAYRLTQFQTELKYQTNRENQVFWLCLEVPTADDDPESWYPLTWGWETEGTVGIVDLGRLWFVRIERAGVTFRPLAFSGCGAKAYEASRRVPAGAVQDALVSAALSTAIPGRADDEVFVAFDTPFNDSTSPTVLLRTPGRYGWSFNRAGTAASLVVAQYRTQSGSVPATPHPKVWLYTISFLLDGSGAPDITLTTVETVDADLYAAPLVGMPGIFVPLRDNLGVMDFPRTAVGNPNNYSGGTRNLDAPVFCYYDATDTLNVTRMKVEDAVTSSTSSTSTCYELETPHLFNDTSDCESADTYAGCTAASGFYGPGWTTVRIADWGDGDSEVTNCYTELGTTFTWSSGRPDGPDLSSAHEFEITAPAESGCDCIDEFVSLTTCEQTDPEADSYGVVTYTIQPYTRREARRDDRDEHSPNLILPNGSATAPMARSYITTAERLLRTSNTTSEAVVSALNEVTVSGFSCVGDLSRTVCGSGGALPFDFPLPTPSTATGNRISCQLETLEVTVAFPTPLALAPITGSWNVVTGAHDPAGESCPCGPTMTASSSTHDPAWYPGGYGVGLRIPDFYLSNPGQFEVTFKAAESFGGAYSIVNDLGCTWAYDFTVDPLLPPHKAQQPWPLSSSHALPATAGSYYSFIGWT